MDAARYPLLSRVCSPADLKTLSREELESLSQDVRAFILEKLSPVGGHLASSLGVVELTVALHAVYDSPRDKIVWDVGHQSYAHKILTGRRDRFDTIRQRGGLSGFPRRAESVHDAFGTGHSSTSISSALGMAVGRDLSGADHKVVAVIGDGSLTAGLAFEGLNHAGHLDRDLVVVLNDNEMSISPNVGALSSYLSRILTGDFYSRLRREVEEFLRSLPAFGGAMARLAKRVEEHIKGFISPGMLFEELGFTYVGPIDGHNLGHLMTAFQNIRKFRKPVLVHVVTQKGRGFRPAEEAPTVFHGVGPFDPCDGSCRSATAVSGVLPAPTYTEVFSRVLVALAERDPRIVAVTAAMPEGTGLDAFRDRFPQRFFDVGIAEQHAVTFAAGLAAEGWIPVVAIYSTFLQRAYDQIVHDVALQGLPVVFAVDRAGLVGADGPTHHGAFDLSYLRHVPGLAVLAPSDEAELADALATAVALGGPAAVRYPRGTGTGAPVCDNARTWPMAKGRLVFGDAADPGVLVLCAGTVLGAGLEAARRAAEEDIQATVFDVRYVKPLDRGVIADLCSRCRGVVTVEENALAGGFGSAVVELLVDAGSSVPPIRRLGLPDEFVEHGSQAELRATLGLDASGILAAIRALATGASAG
ncbi:MAG: 1-deoxy-D-xylulose-5-phosphate synthase [Deltaproteobacteria bacterium]|nr:1-deoxy-D-xylulose-5-phosphate synthase [Deltaproteobacteria bacterium]